MKYFRKALALLLMLCIAATAFTGFEQPVRTCAAVVTDMNCEATIVNLNPGCRYYSGINSDLTGGSNVSFSQGQKVRVYSKTDFGSWCTYYCVSDAGGGYVAGRFVELIPNAPEPVVSDTPSVEPAAVKIEVNEDTFSELMTLSGSVTSKSKAWTSMSKTLEKFRDAVIKNYKTFSEYAEDHTEEAKALAEKFQNALDSLFNSVLKALRSVVKYTPLSKKNKARINAVIDEVDRIWKTLPRFADLIPEKKETPAASEDPVPVVTPSVPDINTLYLGVPQVRSYVAGQCTCCSAACLLRRKAALMGFNYDVITVGTVIGANGGSYAPDSSGVYPTGAALTWTKSYTYYADGKTYTAQTACLWGSITRERVIQLLNEHKEGIGIYTRYSSNNYPHMIVLTHVDSNGVIYAYDPVNVRDGSPLPIPLTSTWLARQYSDINELFSRTTHVQYISNAWVN